MQINLIFSKDSGEICTMHNKIRNIEIMMGTETNDIISEFSESLLQWKEVRLIFIVLIYCIIIFKKQAEKELDPQTYII